MDVASSSVQLDCPVNGPCGGTGINIHPAWVAFYLRIEEQPFRSSAEVESWWREQNCPTDHSGRLILPPEEIPCACTAPARVAA